MTGFAHAQETPDRSSTGGAQTLEDIMARQKQLTIDDSFRSDALGDPEGQPLDDQLGTRGGASDAELWRGLRYGAANITTSSRGPAATTLIQDGGMAWLEFRQGPLQQYGSYLIGGTLLALALFYLIRGKIRIDGPKTGTTILRFKSIERFAHWMLAGSFLILGLTGLVSLFGRKVIIPWLGHDSFSTIAIASKWVHNNISWGFIIALVMIFVLWVVHNLPDRTDIKWLLKGGGIFGGGHPPAKKFNAGQKLIFWSVIVFGSVISATGLSLLFPFELPAFATVFDLANATGLPQSINGVALNTTLAPHEDMQFAQLSHSIASLILIAIIFAHIYIGSVGMEGAYDAMASGEVEKQWAREHHSLWVEEVEAKEAGQTPAE
ncbi:MAG: formate dehydrogenase subunit gamma [Aliishimia sp.]